MSNGHGGYRPGSGRKPNKELMLIRSALDEVVGEDNWRTFARRLHELALQGNLRAYQLILQYRFGSYFSDLPPDDKPVEPVRIIRVYMDGTEIDEREFWKKDNKHQDTSIPETQEQDAHSAK